MARSWCLLCVSLALACTLQVTAHRELHQEQQPKGAVPQQVVYYPVTPGPPPNQCVAFTDEALRATKGLLCTSQYITRTVTRVICDQFKPECTKTVTEKVLLNPAAPGAAPDAYAQTAHAACQVLGYDTFGPGSVHLIGETGKALCWNGQKWITDNYFTNLVCCK